MTNNIMKTVNNIFVCLGIILSAVKLGTENAVTNGTIMALKISLRVTKWVWAIIPATFTQGEFAIVKKAEK